MIKHVSDTIYYERRRGWTNGEEGNGFALWTAMYLQYEGDHVLIKMGGHRLFNKWGKFTMKDNIEHHIRGWQEHINKHATGLINNEEELFYRLLEILPEELKEEMACDNFVNITRTLLRPCRESTRTRNSDANKRSS